LIETIKVSSATLEDVADIKAGLQAYEAGKGNPKQSALDVKNRIYDYDYKFDDSTYKYLDGKDVGRYFHTWSGLYLRYGGNLAAPRTFNVFSDDVLIIREIPGKYPHSLAATFSPKGEVYLFNRSNIAVLNKQGSGYDLKYLLALLCSSLLSYYFMRTTPKAVRQLFPKIILNDLRQFPIKKVTNSQQLPFIEKVEIMLSKNAELHNQQENFLALLKSELRLEKISSKLEQWYTLDFSTFCQELAKKKINLALGRKAEWMEHFEKQKTIAAKLKSIIDTTDREIDQLVYELYGLTSDEIAAVEN
jgi:hypothetical protein